MHARTLRRLAQRLDRIEAAAVKPDHQDVLVAAFEKHGRSGDLGAEFTAAYREYALIRDALEARGVLPPPSYQWDKSTISRVRWWRGLDHPDLGPSTDTMCNILMEYGKQVEAALREGQSDP